MFALADRASIPRGYSYVVNANYAAEPSVTSFPGFSRSVSITETARDLTSAGTGYKTVVVTVSDADGAAIRARLKDGKPATARIEAEVDTGWRKTPLLVAELLPDGGAEGPVDDAAGGEARLDQAEELDCGQVERDIGLPIGVDHDHVLALGVFAQQQGAHHRGSDCDGGSHQDQRNRSGGHWK